MKTGRGWLSEMRNGGFRKGTEVSLAGIGEVCKCTGCSLIGTASRRAEGSVD